MSFMSVLELLTGMIAMGLEAKNNSQRNVLVVSPT
jgi:hypothetical protein